MALIYLWTDRYRPDFIVTLRTSYDWQRDLPGLYVKGRWEFDVPWQEYQSGFEFKFVLEKSLWMEGQNLVVPPSHTGALEFTEGSEYEDGIVFTENIFDSRQASLVENGYFAQKFLVPNLDSQVHYDLIVIGSGFGGGIVAEQAADRGLKVLILEAGSYLFPTHVGNIPRRHSLSGNFNKNIWSLWDDFKVNAYRNSPESQYQGGFGINLGGRSIFWGAYIPRMEDFEFFGWPEDVKTYLFSSGYENAENLVGRIESKDDFTTNMSNQIRDSLVNYLVNPLPLSVRRAPKNWEAVSSGVFSTADLLIEASLTEGPLGRHNLTMNLNHRVTKILKSGTSVTGVECHDLIADINRRFTADRIVLAAGSINSPVIALNSNLEDPSGKIGIGLTDHPIFYIHFYVPEGSDFYNSREAAKLMLHNIRASTHTHRYVAFVDYGSDLGLSRFLDPDTFAEHQSQKQKRALCEVVFQFSSRLVDTNKVILDGVSPTVSMVDCPISSAELDEINSIADQVRASLGGEWIGEWTTVSRAGLGGVAHEVGTLRMGNDGVVDSNLKFHHYDNLFACDLSVFPSSPAANPSLTLAALALRLANNL